MQRKYETVNTFTQRPSPSQIFTYILFTFHLVTFYAIAQVHFSNETTKLILNILFPCSFALQIISSLVTSLIDPSDRFMIRYRNNCLLEDDIMSDKLFCDLCPSYVQSSSKHCRKCSRCVSDFDHHCDWVNNCIGSKNYCAFFVMICSSLSTMLIYLAAVGLLWVESNWQKFLAEMIVLWIGSLVTLVFSFLLGNLIFFHIYLSARKITTYEFIVQMRVNKNVRSEQKNKTEEVLHTFEYPPPNKLNNDPKNSETSNREDNKSMKREEAGNIFDSHQNLNKSENVRSQSGKQEYRESAKTGDLALMKKGVKLQPIFRYQNSAKKFKIDQQRVVENSRSMENQSQQIKKEGRLSAYFADSKMLRIFTRSTNVVYPQQATGSYDGPSSLQLKSRKNTRVSQINQTFQQN